MNKARQSFLGKKKKKDASHISSEYLAIYLILSTIVAVNEMNFLRTIILVASILV